MPNIFYLFFWETRAVRFITTSTTRGDVLTQEVVLKLDVFDHQQNRKESLDHRLLISVGS